MSTKQFYANLTEIFSGAQGGRVDRWSLCNWNDRVIFAHPSVQLQYYVPGMSYARTVPGLTEQGWDGVEVVASHVMVWKGARLKWSDINDFTQWLPVAETAVTFRSEIEDDFEQPGAGGSTPWLHLAAQDLNFVVGQYVRLDLEQESPSTATSNYYQVVETVTATTLSTTSSFAQSVAAAETKQIYLDTGLVWPVGSSILIGGVSSGLEVVTAWEPHTASATTATGSSQIPNVGGSFQLSIGSTGSGFKAGDLVSLGAAGVLGSDIYEVVVAGANLSLKRLGIGTNQLPTGYTIPSGWSVLMQPWVEVVNNGSSVATLATGATLSGQNAVKLVPLGLSGEIPEGTKVFSGSTLVSVDATDAGEVINVGSQINGDVLGVVAIGEYGYVLKRLSIQSIQFVGRQAGTFYFRPEVLDEGPCSKNAWCRIFDSNKVSGIVFVGRKEIFKFTGGQVIEPIGRTFTLQFFQELDRARVDEIVCHHHEKSNEIWIVYPRLGTTTSRVFIYNYVYDTVVIDDYDESLGGLTAAGSVDWEIAPTWREFSDVDGATWAEKTLRWYEYVEDGLQRYTILACGGDEANPLLGDVGTSVPRLLLHGRTFSRSSHDDCNPEGHYCAAETPDYDFDDSSKWKYAYTVQLMVDVRAELDGPSSLFVQLGGRDNLDSPIRWSQPVSVPVQGGGMRTTQANIRCSGRYVRVRFFSQTPGIQWRIASFKLLARMGGTY